MPEYGIAGLAQSGQYDQRINDLYRRQEADQRAEQLASAKTALFMRDVDFQNAANQFDAPRIKDFARKKIQEIGAYYRNNPDLQYNPEKLAQLKIMTNDLKNHPDLLRGLASDTAYKSYLKDLEEVAKNPSQHDTESYQAIKQQWDNYQRFGNQKGEQAAREEGLQPFMYSRPQNLVDLNTALPEIGGRIKNLEKRGGKYGEYFMDIPDNTLAETVKGAFADPGMGRTIQLYAKKQGWTPEQTQQWVASKIKEGVNNDYHAPDYALERLNMQREGLNMQKAELAAKMQGEAPITTDWDYVMNPKNQNGQLVASAATNLLGGTKMIVGGKDLTGAGEWKSDGYFTRATAGPYKGLPLATGYIQMPLEEAVSLGIAKESRLPWGDPEPAPGMGDRVSIRETEHNGKKHKYVHIKHEIPIDPNNQTLRSKYNSMTMNAKHTAGPIDVFAGSVPSASKQDWLNNGWTEEQIQQAASQGKIKVQ